MKRQINMTFDETVVEWIDKERGSIPRSTFVNSLFNDIIHFESEEVNK